MIIKNKTSNNDWIILHDGLGESSNDIRENHLVLNNANQMVDKGSEYFERANNNVFGLRHDLISSSSSDEIMAYCWAAIPGYSAFGKYEGNNNTDGTFIHLGFRARWFLHKGMDANSRNWLVWDSEREPNNPLTEIAFAGGGSNPSSNAGHAIDFVSNGVKIRNNNSGVNPAETFIYSAFAEHPFKTARAR